MSEAFRALLAKDLRLVLAATIGWTLFTVGKAALVAAYGLVLTSWPSEGLTMLIFGLNVFDWVIGLMLAAWLFLEDPAATPRALWRTRPVRPLTLLAAKLTTGLALWVVLPVLALLPIWLWVGLEAADIGLLAADVALQRLVPFLVGGAAVVAFGSLARAMGWLIALPLLPAVAAALGPVKLEVSLPWVLVWLCVGAVLALALTYQQGRRALGATIFAASTIGAAFLTLVVVRTSVAPPWEEATSTPLSLAVGSTAREGYTHYRIAAQRTVPRGERIEIFLLVPNASLLDRYYGPINRQYRFWDSSGGASAADLGFTLGPDSGGLRLNKATIFIAPGEPKPAVLEILVRSDLPPFPRPIDRTAPPHHP